MRVSQPAARAAARTNSNLRILLPLAAHSVRSSRLTQMRGPPRRADRRSRDTRGVGARDRERRGGNTTPAVVAWVMALFPFDKKALKTSPLQKGPRKRP